MATSKAASSRPARKASAKSSTTPAAKSSAGAAGKSPKKAPAAAKKSAAGADDNYTDTALREKLKRDIIAGDKGGRAGQWSARKAQLLAHEYEAQGGAYKHPRTAAQKSLKQWGDEHWHTATGEQAVQGDETHRYLPDAAWKELSPAQREATDQKKVQGSRRGKQFVANTPAAASSRKRATSGAAAPSRKRASTSKPAKSSS